MKRILGILLFVCAGVLPLHAQVYRHAARALLKKAPFSRPPVAARSLASLRAERLAAQAVARQQKAASLRSVQTLKLPFAEHYDPFMDLSATSFVLEETYQGKKYLWGVTVSHYFFDKPILQHPDGQEFSVKMVAQGHAGLNDITLFPLSPQQAENLVALHLASQLPKPGEELHSVGFFDGKLHYETNRIVKEVHPHQIITSLNVVSRQLREGACGGPVLNARNEVVGVHAGSSQRRQLGFVIPAEHIRQTLLAYHQNNPPRPLVFNGKKIGDIHVNEYIQAVEAWKDFFPLRTVQLFDRKTQVDLDHLENLIDFSDADRIIFKIEQTPFSAQDPDQRAHIFVLIYDLQTGTFSWKQNDYLQEDF